MSLHIYIAHSGEHFLADPVSFASYVPLLFMIPWTIQVYISCFLPLLYSS